MGQAALQTHAPATPAPTAGELRTVAIAELDDSPFNPRAGLGDISELKASIGATRMQNPPLVRPVSGGRYQLVTGHRRRACARELGWKTMLCLVREMSDEEAAQVALFEQLGHKDLTAIEEADAYRKLRDRQKLSPDVIAARSGQSRRTVYDRLRLAELCAEGRAQVVAGKMEPSLAQTVAELPATIQPKAVKLLLQRLGPDGLSVRVGRDVLEKEFTHKLDPRFLPLADATLLPSAGACTQCPKRIGGDKGRANVCTDVGCFEKKSDAAYRRQASQIEASGGRAVKEVLDDWMQAPPNCVSPDQKNYDDPKHRTWRQLLGDKAPAVVIGRTRSGDVVKGWDRKQAEEALRAAGHDFARPAARGADAGEAKRRAAEKQKRAVSDAALALIVAAAQKQEPAEAFWRLVLGAVFEAAHHDTVRDVAKRRGWADKDGVVQSRIRTGATGLSAAEVRGLVLELLLTRNLHFAYQTDRPEPFVAACKLYQVDLKAVAAGLKKEAPARARRGKGRR